MGENVSLKQKRIMCFGDSLTWGWVPVESIAPSTRYNADIRWTGRLASLLGPEFEVLEEGLSGRTTDIEDPVDPRTNGAAYLPAALASHLPLDLVILMLGTNDLKQIYARTPFQIAAGVSRLLGLIRASAGAMGVTYPAPKILLMAPPVLGEININWAKTMFADGPARSRELSGHLSDLAALQCIDFLNLADVTATDGIDGIHLTEENNLAIANAVEQKVRNIFATTETKLAKQASMETQMKTTILELDKET